jgi:hypothetical protein
LDLDSKKDKLFAQGHNSTWEVDFKNIPKADQASVIQNKKLVKHMMLPSVKKINFSSHFKKKFKLFLTFKSSPKK